MAPGDLLRFEKTPQSPITPIDGVVREAAIILAERKILGKESSIDNILLAKNGWEDQDLVSEFKRDSEGEKRRGEIIIEAKKLELGLKHLVALMDRRDKNHTRKETGFINMILAANNPSQALVHAFEIERKERLESLDKEEQAA